MGEEEVKTTNDQVADLDLDALVLEKKKLKIDGVFVEIAYPDLDMVLKLQHLGSTLKRAKSASTKNVVQSINAIKEVLYELAPDLKEHKLNMLQIRGIINFISNMNTPPQLKELQAKGIQMKDNEQKKMADASLEQSPTS